MLWPYTPVPNPCKSVIFELADSGQHAVPGLSGRKFSYWLFSDWQWVYWNSSPTCFTRIEHICIESKTLGVDPPSLDPLWDEYPFLRIVERFERSLTNQLCFTKLRSIQFTVQIAVCNNYIHMHFTMIKIKSITIAHCELLWTSVWQPSLGSFCVNFSQEASIHRFFIQHHFESWQIF